MYWSNSMCMLELIFGISQGLVGDENVLLYCQDVHYVCVDLVHVILYAHISDFAYQIDSFQYLEIMCS